MLPSAQIIPCLVQQYRSGLKFLRDKLMQGEAALVKAMVIAEKAFHR